MDTTTPSSRRVADKHTAYIKTALSLAQNSPLKPTNYRVGALLVDAKTDTILASGYTLEEHTTTEEGLADFLPEQTLLYTTVEPCFKRLSGNVPCVDRILRLGNAIKTVYVGVKEPEKFVGENTGRKKLENAGIEVVLVEGMEKEILEVATAGHV